MASIRGVVEMQHRIHTIVKDPTDVNFAGVRYAVEDHMPRHFDRATVRLRLNEIS